MRIWIKEWGQKSTWSGILLFALVFFVYLMLDSIRPYLQVPYPTDIDFLASKQEEVILPHWLWAFYIHITSSVVALACGLTQFSKWLIKHKAQLHKTIGKLYLICILVLGAPSGLVMAFYGNGGLWAQVAFVFQAVFWWGLTYVAYVKIRRGDIEGHAAFMVRSYAMCLSAISLRGGMAIAGMLKYEWKIYCPNEEYWLLCYPYFYIFLAWSSWLFNLLMAELCIRLGILRYYFPIKKK